MILCKSSVSVELHTLAENCVNKFMSEGEQPSYLTLKLNKYFEGIEDKDRGDKELT